MGLAGVRILKKDKKIAADPAAGWLHQADRRVRRNGGIDGIAAALEDRDAGSRSKRLARCDNSVGSGYKRTPGDGAAGWSGVLRD